MRKIYLLAFLSLFFFNSKAQTAAGYYFATNTYVPLEDMTSGSTIVFGPGQNIDDASSNIISLPFAFTFAGTSYTQFSVSTNGLFGFGANQVTDIGDNHVIDQSDTYPILAPWWEDLYTGSNGLVQYKVIGSVNRKFVVEWRERRYSATHLPYNKTFQLWLFEGSNRIQFVYGAGANTFGINAAIGIATSTSDYQNVNSPNNTSSTTNDNLSFVWPGNDTSYSFGVNPLLQASVSVNGPFTICGNGSVLLTASSTATTAATYQWYRNMVSIDGATQNTYNATDSGKYSVQVFAQSESAFSSFAAISVVTPVQVTEQHTNVSCHGQQNGSIVLSTDTNNTISWSGPSGFTAATATISALSGGTYTYTVSNTSQCAPVVGTVSISEPDPVTLTVSSTNVTCNNAANGIIAVTTNGTYTITDANGTDVTGLTNFAPGTYTVNSSVGGNCFATPVTVNISQPDVLAGSIGSLGNATCYGLNNGSITALATGGTAPYTFILNGVSNSTGLFDQLTAGSYSISITDANGCNASLSFTILQPAPLSASASISNVTCYGSSTGSANVSAIGGTGPYTFSLNGVSNSSGAFTSLGMGNYTASVNDANGCTTSIGLIITQPAQLTAIANVVNVSCFGANSGSSAIVVSGGTAPFTYSVNGVSNTTGLFNNLSAGSYGAVVTDTNGCSTTVSFIITQPLQLQASAAVANVNCYGSASGSVTIHATGGISSYNFSVNGINNTTGNFTNLVAGNYTAIITDANGCTTAVSFTITQPSLLQLTASTNSVSCYGTSTGSAIFSASGGTAPYNFTLNGSNNSNGVFNNLSAGSFTVSVTDARGCSVTVPITISQPALLTGSSIVVNVSCFGSSSGAATITANGGTSPYSFSLNGNTNSNGIFNNLIAGSFSATITDAKGCIQPVAFTITQPSALNSSAIVTNVLCNGTSTGSATISASGGTSPYTFKVNTTSNNTGMFFNLAAGSFTATVTDANGCISTRSFTIAQPAALVGSSTVTNVGCFGTNSGSANVTATGGTAPYAYLLNGINNTTGIFNNLSAGSYSTTISDANGCSVTIVVNITQPSSLLTGSASTTNITCNGAGNGSSTITGTGGKSPYTYSINGSSNSTGIFNNLSAGSYSAIITDANGCTATVGVTVSQPATMSATVTAANGACGGSNNGSIVLSNPVGGSGSYQYSLNAGAWQSALSFTALATGNYDVQMRDAANTACIKDLGIKTISNSGSAPVVNISATSGTFCSNLTLTASPAGAASYSWSTGSTAAFINLNNSNPDGAYSVTVTNQSGCSGSATYTYSKQNLLNSYTLLGFSSVTLTKSNNVNGSVGDNTSGKKITIGSNSTVTGFVKASVISVTSPVTITGGSFTSPATVTLPAMYLNTASVTGLANYTVPASATQTINTTYNQLHISKNAVVTVNGSIYGDVIIDDGATVTFTSADFSMNTLNAGNSTTLTVINFAANATIRVKTLFTLGYNIRLNSSNATIYITDSRSNVEKVSISSKNTWVNANIYIPMGNLDIKQEGGVTATNNSEMTGKFIAENINSADFMDWDSYDCSTSTSSIAVQRASVTDESIALNVSKQNGHDQSKQGITLKLNIYPNPNQGNFALTINDILPSDTKVFIYNAQGSLVMTKQLPSVKGQTVYFQIPNPLSGTYLLKLISKTKNESVKFIIAQ